MPMTSIQYENLIKEIRTFAEKIATCTSVHQNEYDAYLRPTNAFYATEVSANSALIVKGLERIERAPTSPAAKVFSKQVAELLPQLLTAVKTYGTVAEHFGDKKETFNSLITALEAAQPNFKLPATAETAAHAPVASPPPGGKM
jgi:hypothetical protein